MISFNGIKIEVQPPDLDGDGNIGGVERLTQDIGQKGIQHINQPTELGESLKELNLDDTNNDMGMSGIDLRANIHYIEHVFITQFDSLVALRFFPAETLAVTRIKKRNSVSINARGRTDVVNVVAGRREQEAHNSGGMMSGIKQFFTPKPKEKDTYRS